MALAATINLVSAARGAAGATAINNAVRAYLRPNLTKRTSRAGNSELPDRVWMLGGQIDVLIETEDSAAILSAITGASAVEVLMLVYADPSGNRTLRIGGAELVDVGELALDPREAGGTVSRTGLTFGVIVNGDDDTLAELFTLT